jgi:SAM-dependent methyltransferase
MKTVLRWATSRQILANNRPRVLKRARWKRESAAELDFWTRWLESGGLHWPDDYRERLDPDLVVAHKLVTEILDQLPQPSISILDVGAGPLTPLGKVYPGKDLKITPIDPLADHYDRLLERLGIEPPVRTIAGHGERLLRTFAADSFDIAFAQNALDHAWDPILVIENMLHVIKPHGYVLLRHMRNEAEHEQYRGLHQWNFDVRSEELILWDRRVEYNVSRSFSHLASVDTFFEYESGECVINAILNGQHTVSLRDNER